MSPTLQTLAVAALVGVIVTAAVALSGVVSDIRTHLRNRRAETKEHQPT